MIDTTINFLDSVPLYPGWLFLFFFGLFVMKLTKYRKLGKTIIIILSIPILFIVLSTILFLFFVSSENHPGGVAFTP